MAQLRKRDDAEAYETALQGLLNNTAISYTAIGLFGEMVHLPDGGTLSEELLAENRSTPVEEVRAALDELAALGHLVRDETEWHLRPTPEGGNKDG